MTNRLNLKINKVRLLIRMRFSQFFKIISSEIPYITFTMHPSFSYYLFRHIFLFQNIYHIIVNKKSIK